MSTTAIIKPHLERLLGQVRALVDDPLQVRGLAVEIDATRADIE